jgi:hypothetical protein
VNRIATLDLPAGIVTLPWPDGVRTSDTPPTERVVAGVNVAEIGSRPGFPKDYEGLCLSFYACPFMPVLLCLSFYARSLRTACVLNAKPSRECRSLNATRSKTT